jgi:hypothetical protein
MSTQITTAFVRQYGNAVQHLTQQKTSKLRPYVRVETVNGRSRFFDQLGSVAAAKRTSRHADTPRMDTPHARRRVTLDDYEYADLIDCQDEIRMLANMSSPYAEAAAMSMGRAIDDVLVDALDATAYTGEDGTATTSYDSDMTVDVQVVAPGVTGCGFRS